MVTSLKANSTHDTSRYPLCLKVIMFLPLFAMHALAQKTSHQCPTSITIDGRVLSASHKPISGAIVSLENAQGSEKVKTSSSATGYFAFPPVARNSYKVSATIKGLHNGVTSVMISSDQCVEKINLIVPAPVSGKSDDTITRTMEFADEPRFSIAGVTDWTAVGGHGSDSTLRMSESLAKESASLSPEKSATLVTQESIHERVERKDEVDLRAAFVRDPTNATTSRKLGSFYLALDDFKDALPLLEKAYRADPTDERNEYELGLAYAKSESTSQAADCIHLLLRKRQNSGLDRLAGELDEKLGDPLTSVKEFQEATKLEPSEPNYFEWGSELLQHRAIWQAIQVFRAGVMLFPDSTRMQTAMATALFAGARYEEASVLLCDLSDRDVTSTEPYVFMGKIQMAAPNELGCVGPRLARFALQNPQNALANYLYAMSILKHQQQSSNKQNLDVAQSLLKKAVTANPQYGEAYLQLGVIAADRSDYPTAIVNYEKAIETDPKIADAYYRLGMAYYRTSQLDKAKKEFRLYDEVKRQQQKAIEQERLRIKQFVFAGSNQTPNILAQ